MPQVIRKAQKQSYAAVDYALSRAHHFVELSSKVDWVFRLGKVTYCKIPGIHSITASESVGQWTLI
jgi:hypothetical protein